MSPHGFWAQLKKPFLVMAPLANVTDVAFRAVFAKYGKPDVMFTEFVSVEALCSRGRKNVEIDLAYTGDMRPIVAQIFGSKPQQFREVAVMLKDMGFDGIDINMGCPDKNVCKTNAGAALIQHPKLAQEIIAATIEGAGGLPVSVKTRVGFNRVELETWIPALLEARPAAITIHARTKKEESLVPARWEHVKEVVEMAKGTGVLIIGNGDVQDREQAAARVRETGCDGVMIGRGIFGNPWRFNPDVRKENVPLKKQLEVMLEHVDLFEKHLSAHKNFDNMKKHFKAYISGFDGAKELRMQLMETKSCEEVRRIVVEYMGKQARQVK